MTNAETTADATPVLPVEPVAPDAEFVHSFKPTIFSRERRFVLGRDSLMWSDGRKEERTALADIDRIRLYAVPSGMGPLIRRAVISRRAGRKLVLQSAHFKGFGVIEDRAASYRAIVEALVARVAAASPLAEILVGPSALLWGFWLSVLVASGLVLAIGLVLVAVGQFPMQAGLYLGLIVIFFPIGWRFVTAGRARRADPKALPHTAFTLD